MEFYECAGTIAGGKIKLFSLDMWKSAFRLWTDGDVIIRVERPNAKRTNRQNKFWHAVVIPAFAEHCGYRPDEMKEALALKLIPKEIADLDTGEVRIVPGHTSDLNVKEFNDLIERAQQLGAEMDVYIPDPDPNWRRNRERAA